jgi:hypothetical protein
MTTYSTYSKLQQQQGNTICYADLLLTAEWRAKRQSILQRDGYTCSQCHKGETLLWPHAETGVYVPHEVRKPLQLRGQALYVLNEDGLQCFRINKPEQIHFVAASENRRMHVHHRLYIHGRLPWVYDDEHLETMCEKCHFDWHRKYRAKVYRQIGSNLIEMGKLTPCIRCNGAGRFPEYSHVEAGICFRCRGACYEEWIKWKPY